MRRILVLSLFAALAITPLAVTAQEAGVGGSPRLENLVPEHTFLYASLNDLPKTCREFSRSALGKIWAEEEVQQFVRPLLKMVGGELKKAEQKLGHTLTELSGYFNGQAALAIVAWDPMTGIPIPDAVLLVDLGEKRPEFELQHRKLMAQAAEKLEMTHHEHEGIAYDRIVLPQGIGICAGYLGNALVVTSGPERMNAVIAAHRNGLATSLAKSDNFTNVMAKTGGSASNVTIFANVQSIVGYFADQMGPDVIGALEASGLDGLKGIGFGSRFVGEGVRETIYLHMPGEKRGFPKLFYTSPGNAEAMLDRIPASAFYASAGRVNFPELMNVVTKTLGDVEPMLKEQVQEGIYYVEEMLGLSIQEDILKPLGEEYAGYMALPAGGGLIPDFVVMGTLKKPDHFLQTMGQLVERAKMFAEDDPRLQVELRHMTFQGKTIHYVHVGHKWGDPFPVTPSLMVDGDFFAVALYPQVLKDMVARGADFKSIKTRPDFQRVMKGLPADMDSVEYVDLHAAARLLYGTLVPVAQAMGKDMKIPVDFALLPRTDTVTKHLFGAAWGGQSREDGVSIHMYSPTGVAPLMVAASAAMFFATSGGSEMPMPTMRSSGSAKPRENNDQVRPAEPKPPVVVIRPKGVNASPQLKSIYEALLYHYVETGEYPKALAELVKSRALNTETALLSPTTKRSFEYTGPAAGHLLSKAGEMVWVYEGGNASGSRWVLFSDGAVKRVAEAQFLKLLAGTVERLKK